MTESRPPQLEFGIFSFGDTYPHPVTGVRQAPGENLAHVLERIRLADRLGLDYFGVGEHHRSDFSISACSTVLAAAASTTERIHLGTATTVLTTEDPVRLYEQFATLDLISGGRAELGVGSGVFVEPFALFGGTLEDKAAVFAEKLELLTAIDARERITFTGSSRPPIDDAEVWPRATEGHLSIWQATGPSSESFHRAARLGLSVQTAATGGDLTALRPLVARYRADGLEHGWPASRLRVAIGGHGIIDDDSRRARDEFFPHYRDYIAGMRANRGKPAPTRARYDELLADPGSGIFAGDPEQVAAKIVHQYRVLGHDRHIFQIDWRAVPHDTQVRTIELLATEVVPLVRAALASDETRIPSFDIHDTAVGADTL
ncbi:LLM class flavin-dependent oxidoreductase [Nocardia aurea]|uniref:LLM class flavin-dependent oxidoreductase n=1 Tax=Nocardia aurea TaxID=2144174 RepID=UPI0033B4301D